MRVLAQGASLAIPPPDTLDAEGSVDRSVVTGGYRYRQRCRGWGVRRRPLGDPPPPSPRMLETFWPGNVYLVPPVASRTPGAKSRKHSPTPAGGGSPGREPNPSQTLVRVKPLAENAFEMENNNYTISYINIFIFTLTVCVK